MNFNTMTWVEEARAAAATATGAAGMVVDQSPQENAPMNIDSSSAGGGDERHSNSSEDCGGSGSEGGAEESSSSSSSVPVVMATRRSSSVIQKQQEEQVEEDSDNSNDVSAANAKKMSSDQQNSSPLSASVTVKPGAVVKNSYKDYSHEFPTEKQLYLQQPGVATAWEEELVAAWEQELFTTTTNRGTAACLFPLKLHEILSDHAEQLEKSIVVWQPHGRSFKIHNQEQFVERILPKYFSSSA
jgi:HSF-type DNA-binding